MARKKNGNGNNKPKKKKSRGKRKGGGTKNPPMAGLVSRKIPLRTMSTSDENMLTAMCNPFSAAAHGCKYPDGYSSTSIAIQARGFTQMGSNAAGGGLAVFTTQMPSAVFMAGATTPGPPVKYDFSAAVETQVSTPLIASLISTNGGFYRINCAGIAIRCSQNAMTAQGSIVISRTPFLPNKVPGVWVVGSMQSTDVTVEPIVAGAEYVVLFRPLGMGARSFQSSGTAGAAPTWDNIVVELSGAVATTAAILTIEYVYNIELAPRSADQQYFEFATKSPPAHPVMQRVIDAVSNAATGVFEGGVQAFGDSLKQRIYRSVAPTALRALPMLGM